MTAKITIQQQQDSLPKIRFVNWQPQRIEEAFYNADDFNNKLPQSWEVTNNNISKPTDLNDKKSSSAQGGSINYLLALACLILGVRIYQQIRYRY